MNNLIKFLKNELISIILTLSGEIVSNIQMEHLINELLEGVVPDKWKKYSFLSLKPLGGWLKEIK